MGHLVLAYCTADGINLILPNLPDVKAPSARVEAGADLELEQPSVNCQYSFVSL